MLSLRGADLTRRASVPLLLVGILAVAAWLRFYGLNWDGGHHLHPDERFLAIVGDKIRMPSDPGAYFDTHRSPLNPYNQGFDGFAYGTLPLFLARAIAEPLGMATYDRLPLVGRALSAGFDLGTVVLAFLLGRLVYTTAVGLVAAALVSVTVLHIQLSHFFAVDTFLAFWTTLALYAAYRVWLRGGVGNGVLLGLALGAAAATKLSAALLLPIVGLVAVVRPPGQPRLRPVDRWLPLGMCGLVALLSYRLSEPYSFAASSVLGFLPNFQRFADLDRWVKVSSGEIEVPFMIQWAGTPNPWFAVRGLTEWGFGPVAGLAVLAGLVIAALQLRHWSRCGRHLLLVAWAAIYLGYFSFQFAKFLRYFLPIYPVLSVLGAFVLVAVADAHRSTARPVRILGRLTAPTVLASTALYALMFTSIYGQPNTRVTASEWIYDNVPAAAALGVEHWDDALPLSLPGRERRFAEVSMELYEEESPQKARKLTDNLRRADYLIISSNRLVGSIPRLPQRYPIAVEYYRLLFAGELGFEPVAQFESHPRLLGLSLADSTAQEDFTVYDHPTVLIFRKGPDFSAETVANRLAAVPLDQLERVKPAEAGTRRGLLLSAQEWARVPTSGTWSESFAFDGLASRFAIPSWLIVVELLSAVAVPSCWWLFRSLPDRGYAVSKVVGLVVVSYVAWLAASLELAPFGRGLIIVSCGTLACVATAIVLRRRREIVADLRSRHRWLLTTEGLFLGTFGVMVAIRSANPDLWHPSFGGEKPMDFAYLNAVIKSPSFPPYDPWFAGGYINYYYYGFVLIAVLVHLSSVPPAQAYNLAVATIFAMTAVVAFSFGSAVVYRRIGADRTSLRWPTAAGVTSTIVLCLLGNVDGALQLRDALWQVGSQGLPSSLPLVTGLTRAAFGLVRLLVSGTVPPFDFWRSTRFIGPEEPGPIHEFPYFTFLYGDLHAHMVALPLQVTAVMVGLELVRAGRSGAPIRLRARPSDFLRSNAGWPRPLGLLLLAALLIGTLRATNTWDLPTYLALTAAAGALMLGPGRRIGWLTSSAAALALVAGLYGVSTALFLPFLRRYELFYSGVVPVETVTNVGQFLAIHAVLFSAVGGWLAVELGRVWRLTVTKRATSVPHAAYYSLAVPAAVGYPSTAGTALTALGLGALFVLAQNGRGVIGLLLACGAVVVALGFLRRRSTETLFLLTMAGAALGALLLPELVAIRGDVGRMNTVFKFYLQAWVLLALLAGPATVLVVRRILGATRRSAWTTLWACGLALLLGAALVYPLRATPAKLALRFAPLGPTLDGMAFMSHAAYAPNGRDLGLAADHAAIRWMLENVAGTPVILEGRMSLYQWGSRFSIYTGLPTVLGWDWHQKQQRWGYQGRVDERQRDVQQAYETTDWWRTEALLRKYGVRYVVVGGLERAYYPAAGLEKFERAIGGPLEVAYRDGGVTIYRVIINQ